MKKNSNSQRIVYNFISPIKMKFKSPTKESQSEIRTSSVLSKIKSFSWAGDKNKSEQKINATQKQSISTSTLPNHSLCSPLQFIKKLTTQHFLVGNQFKVDVMYLGGIVDDFIDTEYIWSMDFKKGISNISVDSKKCFLAFLVLKQVQIYQYNLKKSKELPILLSTIKTSGQVKFIQFAKDSFLTLFYQNTIEIYYIDQNTKAVKKRFSKQYNQPEGAIIFQVPQAFQGVINIFFTQPKPDTSMFHLWNLEVKLQKQQIVMGSFLKIYDISNGLMSKIVLSNYSMQIFCMNLGHQILAVKKGYIIDTVNSNIQDEHSVLRYLGNDRLIHVLSQKIQLYRFSLNMTLSPPRIILESTDSIWSKMNESNYVFLEVLEMLHDNIVVFYQVSEEKNNSLSGEIKYAFNVTQKVKFQDKVKNVLPSPEDLQRFKNNPSKKISDDDYELIQEKVDMAMKMGLTRRDIYLKLWNNSTKCDIVDFQFLLDTMDYDTIRAQIQNKLKKKSMVLREVIKIEEGCIALLQRKTFSKESTPELLKNFLISHFLLRKLKLYQLFSIIQKSQIKSKKSLLASNNDQQKQSSQTIMINIKDYVGFAKCDLKAVLLELIRDLCINKKDTVLKIRTLVKLFRFSFRPIYAHLLDDIIKEAGNQLLVLLQAIPEVLPYEHQFTEEPEDATLYEGIWGNILSEEWESNLYVGGISTIYNKQIVEQMKKSVWEKRFFLTLHDLLPYQKTEILEIHERNKAQKTFYNFIEKVFLQIKDKQVLKNLITFIEDNYQKLPRHLAGRIFLYKALFDYLKRQNALQQRVQKGQLSEFLKLKDFETCKLIFDLEKRKKHCILKDVKEGIYNCEQFSAEGNDIFNLGLLNFFSSKLSQISDIKYLLNRLNNEKYEFHSQNQGMYEVIVKGMQAKLYLGSDHDIPIDEVYIYISNIHIEQDSEIKKDLRYLDIINKHSQRLRRVKLNMNVFEIIREVEKVLSILVHYEVKERKVFAKSSDTQILKQSIIILDQIQKLKNQIYFQSRQNKNIVLFTYLTIILQRQDFIHRVITLLNSEQLSQRYDIHQILIENAVLFMYKKRFSENRKYKHNQSYIKELLTLLPQHNQTRIFISYEIQLGITLSCEGNQLQYPLGGQNAVLSTIELESAIDCLPGEIIKGIDFDRIYEISLKMQEISSDGKISSITLYQIYEIVILRLLECRLIKDSIKFVRKIIELNPINPYNFIYPVILIKKFSPELCDENKAILLMILTYLFDHPDQLLDAVEELLSTKCTSLEQKIVLKRQLKKVQGQQHTFSTNNPILNPDYLQALTSPKHEQAFGSILRKTLSRIISLKEEFMKNPQYTIIYTILINNPYAIVKYLYCSRYQSNFKGIRCFFSYLHKEDIFRKTELLELGKRVFMILHEGLSETDYIENVIDKYKQTPLGEIVEVKRIKSDTNLSSVMGKCVERFKNKLKEEMNPSKKRKAVQQQISLQERRTVINYLLENEVIYEQITSSIDQHANEYPFHDSDNELQAQQPRLRKLTTGENTRVDFDPIFQRQLLISRDQPAIGLYLSQQYSAKQKEMFYSKKVEQLEIKNSVVRLKNKKNDMENQYNLKMSVRQSSQGSHKMSQTARQFVPLKHSDSIQLTDSVDHLEIKRHMKPHAKSTHQIQHSKQHPLTQRVKSNQHVRINEQVESNQEINVEVKELQISPAQNNQTNGIDYDSIIRKVHQLTQGQTYDISPITQTELTQQQFKHLISTLYHSDHFTSSQVITIIKKLSSQPTVCLINKEIVEVFVKMDNFQKKFNLDIDFKQMFSIEGIFIESKGLDQFFSLLKNNIIEKLNESNVYKITKVISLVFKNNQIQQQLNVAFLIKLLQQFDNCTGMDPKQVKMKKEKIRAFTQKIAIQQLDFKDQDILNIISSPEFKKQMVNTIAQTMRKKKNQDMADAFLNKWTHQTQELSK